MTNLTLSSCQQKALEALSTSTDNVFLTGAAGTGKSFLLREFLKTQDRKVFPVLASTGTAAILVGGRTFHSFFGLGIMEGGSEKTLEKALSNKRVVKRICDIKGFVLDEVSMISGETFFTAEKLCRLCRKNEFPWGGLRVIATGDFSQLPPVSRNSKTPDWAFLNASWALTGFKVFALKTMMRSQDEVFMNVLNHIRVGNITEDVRAYLNRKTDHDAASDQHSSSTFLVARRDAAEKYNQERLELLKTKLHEIPTEYVGEPKMIEVLKSQAPVNVVLQLKKSALVMIRVNDPGLKFVNGTLAIVVDIGPEELHLELVSNGRSIVLEKHSFGIQNADGKEIASATNFPVTLAYATTIHKSQGATLDTLTCDLQRLWESGQAYVALSRLKSGAGLTLLGWDESSLSRVDHHVKSFYENILS